MSYVDHGIIGANGNVCSYVATGIIGEYLDVIIVKHIKFLLGKNQQPFLILCVTTAMYAPICGRRHHMVKLLML